MNDPNEIPIDPDSGVEERPQNRREWSGPLRSIALPVVIVATIVGVLWYIDRERGGGGGADDGYGIVALPEGANTTGRGTSTEIGRAAPDFLLPAASGGDVRLSALRGTPLVVNFWATWCAECRAEMPEIVRASREHDGDLAVLAVNLQENAAQIDGFARDFGMEFAIPIDRDGEVASAWRIGGPIEGIPATYFLDADGIVRARHFGPLDGESLGEGLAAVGVE